MSSRTLRVSLPVGPDRSYDIVTGAHLLDHAGEILLEKLGKRRCLIVSDETVAALYLKRLERALEQSGHAHLASIILPPGEPTKDWGHLQSLLADFAGSGADRKSLVLALGGGVIGDISGLAASLYMRGIDFVQIPTTLLAQVDSSVGGKTAIDTPFGKNAVGTFHQPRLVLTDVETLATLPRRQRLAGYAEIVKSALALDAASFAWCEENGPDLIEGHVEKQIEAVQRCCALKAKIVMEDERESGKRALLNLGHTFGHALEAATGFSDALLHGEAVAIGTCMAFTLSVRMGLCPNTDAQRVIHHLSAVGLPTHPPDIELDIDNLIALMSQDKKVENGQIALILASRIGEGFIAKGVDPAFIQTAWKDFLR